MDSGANTVSVSAAHHLIEGLLEAGIEYLFSNMGTDHAPIIEEMMTMLRAIMMGTNTMSVVETLGRMSRSRMRWRCSRTSRSGSRLMGRPSLSPRISK